MLQRLFPALLLLSSLVFAQQAAKQLTIESIFADGGITGREPEAVQWSPDQKKVSYVLRDSAGEHGQLWYVDLATGKPAILVTEERLNSLLAPASKIKNEREKERRQRYSVAAYHWAPDSKHLLFDANGQLWLYSLDTQTGIPVTLTPQASDDPKFSPDGGRISFVRDNNLVVRSLTKPAEKQLTKDKDANIINGDVDWVYAEELEVRSNYFWEPNGQHIVFMQMNEGGVPTHPIENFIPTHPTVDYQKYPQAGDANPKVRIGVTRSDGGGVRWIKLPEQKGDEENAPSNPVGAPNDIYIPRFGWVKNGILYAEVLNRAQDTLKLYFIDAGSGRSQLMLTEKSDAWVEVNDDFRLIDSNGFKSGATAGAADSPNQFLWSSWRDGHTHLYLYSFDARDPLAHEAKLERQLTSGNWEVEGINAVLGNTIFFTANKDNDIEHQIYSVALDKDSPAVTRLSHENGTHTAGFPEDSSTAAAPVMFVDKFSSLATPPTLSLCRAGGDCQKFWEAGSVAEYGLLPHQLVDFTAEDGTVLHGTLLLPPNADAAAPRTIPLLMNPYGGPGVQNLVNAWPRRAGFFEQLMAREGFATLIVDNRGEAGRGKKFTAVLKRNFGPTELKDQLAALDQTLAKFPQLDPQRMGWWGWSYGGYMTIYAMTHSDRFRAGFSGAPVTDWRDYDTIYTERYMGLPQENQAAYDKSSVIGSAANLHGDLIIAHGTGDDNVHLQNTLQMVQAFIEAGKRVGLTLYPGKTHSMLGADVQTDLYHRIHDYFVRELRPAVAPASAGQVQP